jgi:hypothetical protein
MSAMTISRAVPTVAAAALLIYFFAMNLAR